MKETADILLEVHHAVRGKMPDQEHGFFVGVSELDAGGGPNVRDFLIKEGWIPVASTDEGWVVTIELPEGVHYGKRTSRGVSYRLFGDEHAVDGNGYSVYASVPLTQCGRILDGDHVVLDVSNAVHEAIKDGVCLYLPVAGGGHTNKQIAKVLDCKKVR